MRITLISCERKRAPVASGAQSARWFSRCDYARCGALLLLLLLQVSGAPGERPCFMICLILAELRDRLMIYICASIFWEQRQQQRADRATGSGCFCASKNSHLSTDITHYAGLATVYLLFWRSNHLPRDFARCYGRAQGSSPKKPRVLNHFRYSKFLFPIVVPYNVHLNKILQYLLMVL